jgi:hypothetical protein
MNALYSGYSKVPLLLGQYTTTYVVHYYNQIEGIYNNCKIILFKILISNF